MLKILFFPLTILKIRWYYDGELVRETTKKEEISLVPEFLIISGQIKDYWVDCEMEENFWPDFMFTDFVRVWKYS